MQKIMMRIITSSAEGLSLFKTTHKKGEKKMTKKEATDRLKELTAYLHDHKNFIYHLRGHLAEELNDEEIDLDEFKEKMAELNREEMHIYEMFHIIDPDS